jgi:hypothetical protein
VTDRSAAEVDAALLSVLQAREQAELKASELADDGAEAHLIDALGEVARDLRVLHERFESAVQA